MAHVAKYSRAALGHMFKHYERAKDNNGEYIKFGNIDIDTSKSQSNYNLAVHQTELQGSFVKKRCSEVYCLDRKDVNVVCSWIVTQPKEISSEESFDFFRQTYNFLESRYGKDNVVSAYVHTDETMPHMHFAFVPVVYDKKKECHKVSAKEVLNRRELQTFHKDLSKHLEKVFGRDVGVLNGATVDGNKSVVEMKRRTTSELAQAQRDLTAMEELRASVENRMAGLYGSQKEEFERMYKQKETAKAELSKLNKRKNQLETDVEVVKKQKEALQSEVDKLEEKKKKFEVKSWIEPVSYKVKTDFLGNNKHVELSVEDYKELKQEVLKSKTLANEVEDWRKKAVYWENEVKKVKDSQKPRFSEIMERAEKKMKEEQHREVKTKVKSDDLERG